MEKTLISLEDLQAEAAACVSTLAPLRSGATLLTLSGELGAGKTSYAQGLARSLGVVGSVTSPTYVLEKIYELPESQKFRRLIHIDAYRLTTGADLHTLGFRELMEASENLIVLEWPERVTDGLPPATVAARIEVLEDGSRRITYHHA